MTYAYMPASSSAAAPTLGAAFAVYAAASYAVLRRINDVVAQPYMDEIFHVPQAQRYGQGDFGFWDPKLTTPPGLYLVSTVPAHVLRVLGPGGMHVSACSTAYLRTTNWALSLALFWVLADIVRLQRPGRSPVVCALTTLGLALFPVSFFLHHLYYTDTGSLLFVLVCYALSLRGRHWAAGAAGFAALWFRQTNAVWVAFVGFAAALRLVQGRAGVSASSSLKESIFALCRWAVRADRRTLGSVIWLLAPYVAVVLCFVLFVFVNQGIVLGDKSHHQAGLHVPQMLYFCAYLVGSSAPAFANLASPLWFVRAAASRQVIVRLAAGLALALFMGLCIKNYTVEHPFLLSDNRHYPFYIWKNVFRRHWLARYLAIPLYIYAASAIRHVLSRQTLVLWQLALFVCTAAVLVPSPLLEFRYFTVPYYFVRLHARQPSSTRYAVAEIAWFAAINAATLWVFLYRPFTWQSEPGQLQRFMW
ncbi:glucosyltransferase [Coemansia sp. RSA 2598]|nr:glucosyltransferase [Coemansia sp. RSA 2598]